MIERIGSRKPIDYMLGGIESIAGSFTGQRPKVIPWAQLDSSYNSSAIMRLTRKPDAELLICNGMAKMWRVKHNGFTYRVKQEPRLDSFSYEWEALHRLTTRLIRDANGKLDKKTLIKAGFPVLGGVDFTAHAILMLEVRGSTLDNYYNPAASAYHRLNIGRQLIEIIKKTHAVGISHSDFWPDNLLYCPETKVLSLIDFGSCGLSCNGNTTSSVILGHKKDDNTNGPWCVYRPRETSFIWRFNGVLADRFSAAAIYYALTWGESPLQATMSETGTPYLNQCFLYRQTEPLLRNGEERALLDAIIANLHPDPEERGITIEELSYRFEEAIREYGNI